MTTEAVKDVAKAAAPVEESNGVDKKKSPSGDGVPAAAAPPSKKSVPKPDEAAMKAACDELGAKIEKNKKRLEQIKNVLAERAEKKKTGGSPAMQALREKLANLREQFKTELAAKQALRAELEAATKARESARAAARDAKARVEYATPEAIDARVAALETHIQHESLTLAEEKKVVEELNKLRVARKTVAAAAAKASAAAAGAAAGEAARGTLVERLKASDARIDAVKAEEEKTRAEVARLREEEDKATAAAAGGVAGAGTAESGAAAVAKLIAERDACRAASNEAYEKIKGLRAEFKARNDAWWEVEKEARKARAAERKAKQAAFEAERAARDAERRAARAELAGEPFEREVMACEQLTSYLTAVTAPSPAAAAALAAASGAASSSAPPPPPPPPGFKPVEIKKGTRAPVADDDLLALAGSAKQRGKGARARAAKAAAAAASAAEDAASPSRLLTHSLEILSAFGSLGLALPLTAGDVPAALSQLEEKRAAFLAKRERVKANGGVDPDAPPPADEKTKKERKESKKEKKEAEGEEEEGDAAADGAAAEEASSPAKAKKAGGGGDDGDEDKAPVDSPASDDAGVSVSVSVGAGSGSDAVAVKLSVPSSSDAAAAAASK